MTPTPTPTPPGTETGTVLLRWTDTADPAGTGYAILTRARADKLVAWIRAKYGTRYELSIETWRTPFAAAASPPKTEESPLVAFLAFAASVLSFLVKYRAAASIVAAGLGVGLLAGLSIYLPTSHLRVYPAVALGITAFLSGFLISKLPPPTL